MLEGDGRGRRGPLASPPRPPLGCLAGWARLFLCGGLSPPAPPGRRDPAVEAVGAAGWALGSRFPFGAALPSPGICCSPPEWAWGPAGEGCVWCVCVVCSCRCGCMCGLARVLCGNPSSQETPPSLCIPRVSCQPPRPEPRNSPFPLLWEAGPLRSLALKESEKRVPGDEGTGETGFHGSLLRLRPVSLSSSSAFPELGGSCRSGGGCS